MSKGLYFALVAAFVSGFSIFINKILIIKGIEPLTLNIIKNSTALLLISIVVINTKFIKKNITLNMWLRLAAIGIIGGGIPFILFFEGLKFTSAINATLIHKTLFVWVGIFAFIFLKEKIRIWQIIGYLLIILCNFFIGGLENIKIQQGEIMILSATILWSLENILSKKVLTEVNSEIVSWARMFFGSIFLIIVALFTNKVSVIFSLDLSQASAILISGILLSIYVLSFYKSIQYLPVSLSTTLLVSSTVVTNILTVIFITHKFSANDAILNISTVMILFLVYRLYIFYKDNNTTLSIFKF